ncbi:transmembrane protein 132A [Cuculus canorus]|uniref:transmembrane protein 132A n=1 Tax=Cuculus canorus TaxID=55661 RepID=UPI0023AB2E45|nr:transmembrane protein 132A [Cuculus canorus]
MALALLALLCAAVRGDGDPPDPVYLPADLEVLGVPEHYRLQRADQDLPANASLSARTETFLLLRRGDTTQSFGSTTEPLVQATYSPFSTRQEVPTETPPGAEAWAIRAVSLESAVSPAEPFARVLFHLQGPDWLPGQQDHLEKQDHLRKQDHTREQVHLGQQDHLEQQDHLGKQDHPRVQDHPRDWDHLGQQDHLGKQDHPGDQDHPRQQDHLRKQEHPKDWDHLGQQNHLGKQDHPRDRDHRKDQDHPEQQDHLGKPDHSREWDHLEEQDHSRQHDHPREQDLPCVTLHVHHRGRVVRGTCRLQAPLGTCVVELEIPPRWFSTPSPAPRSRAAEPPEQAELHYSVVGPRACDHAGIRDGSRDEETPPRSLGTLELRAAEPARRQEVQLDEKVLLRVPDTTLRPGQRFTATVALRHNFTAEQLTLRIKAKKGLQVVGVRPASPNAWTTQLERSRGPKHSTAVVTCRRTGDAPSGTRALLHAEVLVEDGPGPPARPLSWQLEYPGQDPDSQKDKLLWEIHVSQRDVRALVPLVQELEILNTAPLTGVPRVVLVKLVAVEAGGNVVELSEAPSCESADKQVLQVSEGCDAVFVGGKESRGARGARVDFWWRRLRAALSFTVWAPLLPLRVQLGDTTLEQVRGWRLPGGPESAEAEEPGEEGERRARGCRPQYQRTALRVLAHFVAHPLDGGRHLAYLPGPEWLLDVTHLVAGRTRVQDPRVASLEGGTVVVGQEPGVTSVEVRSPLSDSILGEQMLVVSEEKVTVTELRAQVVSGLALTLRPEPGHPGVVTATTQGTATLRVPKQEATVSVWLSFSDHTLAPLELYGWQDAALTVTSLDPSVATVGGSPGVLGARPWVVAEGPGRGDLLQLSLLPPDACRRGRHRATALATSTAWLEVGSGWRTPTPGSPRPRGSGPRPSGGGPRSSSPFPRAEGAMSGEAVTAASEPRRRDPAGVGPASTKLHGLGSSSEEEEEEEGYGHNRTGGEEEEEEDEMVKAPQRVTDLEIGMYVLLGVFCLAIFIFLVNCIFFVLRYQQKELPDTAAGPAAPQPHNWVWLGTNQEELSRQLDRRQPEPPIPEAGGETGRCCCGVPPGTAPTTEAGGSPGTPTPGAPLLRKEGATPGGGRRKRVEFVTFAPARVPEEPPQPAPNVQSILVASEDDIRWVCEDMGLRDPEEIRSYMERIRGSS